MKKTQWILRGDDELWAHFKAAQFARAIGLPVGNYWESGAAKLLHRWAKAFGREFAEENARVQWDIDERVR